MYTLSVFTQRPTSNVALLELGLKHAILLRKIVDSYVSEKEFIKTPERLKKKKTQQNKQGNCPTNYQAFSQFMINFTY